MRHHLKPGERVLWEGQPPQGLLLTAAEVIAFVPFLIVGLAFGVYVALNGAPIHGPIVVFMTGGLLVGRFWHLPRVRRETRYALTDRRVMFFREGRPDPVVSILLTDLDRPSKQVDYTRDKNSGTIFFTDPSARRPLFGPDSWDLFSPWKPPRFELASEVESVYQTVIDAWTASPHTHANQAPRSPRLLRRGTTLTNESRTPESMSDRTQNQ